VALPEAPRPAGEHDSEPSADTPTGAAVSRPDRGSKVGVEQLRKPESGAGPARDSGVHGAGPVGRVRSAGAAGRASGRAG